MSAVDDLLLFGAFLVGIFILWIIGGGPEHAEEKTASSSPSSIAETYQTPSSGYSNDDVSGNSVNQKEAVQKEIRNAQSQVANLEDNLEEVRLWGVRSPYEGQVSIYSSNGPQISYSPYEYVAISASSQNDAAINMTGWRLQSAITGNYAYIGTGTTLPIPGRTNNQVPITLSPRESAVILTGKSPLGTSFKANMCMGYLAQTQSFYPDISDNCPDPLDELKASPSVPITDDTCYDFVERLPSCPVIRTRDFTDRGLSSQCKNFLETQFGYNACVQKHSTDPNFIEPGWRIYLGSVREFWRQEREIIRLLDREGKTVDVLSY